MGKKRKLAKESAEENDSNSPSKNKKLNKSENNAETSVDNTDNTIPISNGENIGKETTPVKPEDNTVNASEENVDDETKPTTKKPPRKSGETKKQYKRRIKSLREAGLLIDPPVVEGVKKEKRNPNKSRKEKRMILAKKNDELDKFRSIVQANYLKDWKNDRSKWKFNKNVQGKLIKHMFNISRVPNDLFEILIEYMSSSDAGLMHQKVNKTCTAVVEAMERWTSASEEEKKKMTEPSVEVYERARQVLQSLAL